MAMDQFLKHPASNHFDSDVHEHIMISRNSCAITNFSILQLAFKCYLKKSFARYIRNSITLPSIISCRYYVLI